MRNTKRILFTLLIFSFLMSCDDSVGGKTPAHPVGTWIGTLETTLYRDDSVFIFNPKPNNKIIFNEDKTGEIRYSNNLTVENFIWVYLPTKNEMNLMIEDVALAGYFSNVKYELLVDKPTEQHWKLEKRWIVRADSTEQLIVTEWLLEKEE